MPGQQHRYEVLTHTGPGTPMGELMRQYWIPALMSSELIADGDPVRVKLLSEDLVAFRTTSGKVGLMDQRCPHRVASLFYGRNEEDGIRCVYHGWKFDADGKCVDQGNIPVEQQFGERTPAKAYPTREAAGLVWAYMGHAAALPELPPLPIVETTEQISIRCLQVACSWLQRMEGDIDTSHAGFLHADNTNIIAKLDPKMESTLLVQTDRRPKFKSEETEYGTIYAGWRPYTDTHDYYRIGHFLFPFFSMTGAPPLGAFNVTISVPMDDEHHMRYSIQTESFRASQAADGGVITKALGVSIAERQSFKYLPNTTDWFGRWRLANNLTNDHLIDREKQRHGGSYSGIIGVGTQDQAICESMGAHPSYDFENLAPSDLMIVKTRGRILNALDDMKRGIAPPGVKNPEIYRGVKGGYANLPKDRDWLQAYADHTRHTVRPAPQAAAE